MAYLGDCVDELGLAVGQDVGEPHTLLGEVVLHHKVAHGLPDDGQKYCTFILSLTRI